MRHANLIFDVGCHRGDDTAYYLAKGFRVVAIEANPTLYEGCLERFAAEVRDGRLQLLHRCVSDVREEVSFFINDNDGWSSFVASVGVRGGRYREVRTSTVPLDELVREFGTPYFMKVDVEGAECRLLGALARCEERPTVLALEVDFYEGDPVADLEALGYDRFRLIRQPHLEPDPELPGWEFTRCSSGPLSASLLGNAVAGPEVRREFEAVCGQSYRWHDLYAIDTKQLAAQGWPRRMVHRYCASVG